MAETFLEALTPEEVTDLRASGRERHYEANVALFHEGDDAGSVIVLLAGRVKLTVPSSSRAGGDRRRARAGRPARGARRAGSRRHVRRRSPRSRRSTRSSWRARRSPRSSSATPVSRS